jgi:hypothetical protein
MCLKVHSLTDYTAYPSFCFPITQKPLPPISSFPYFPHSLSYFSTLFRLIFILPTLEVLVPR